MEHSVPQKTWYTAWVLQHKSNSQYRNFLCLKKVVNLHPKQADI